MGLENVKQEVLNEAQQKASSIIKDAEKEAKEIESKATLEVDEYRKEAEKRNDALVQAMERKMLSAARFDAQRLQMNTKKEFIEKIIEETKTSLTKLNKTEKKKFVTKLLAKAKREMDVEIIFVNKNDLELISGLKAKPIEISGGLIAENKEGTISINLSVEELLESAQNELLVEISGVLFGKN